MAHDVIRRPVVRELLKALQHGEEWNRVEAAKALVSMRDPEIVPVLLTLLGETSDQGARKWSAYALGLMDDLRAKPALIAALLDSANALEVRCYAAEGLGHLLTCSRGYADARIALIEILQQEPAELRFWAAFALGAIGIKQDIPTLQPLAESDHRTLEGWGSVSQEASEAIEMIRSRGRRRGYQ